MSVTLELTELEADYVTQALVHELDMAELMEHHADAFEPETVTAVTIKIALLRGLIQKLTAC